MERVPVDSSNLVSVGYDEEASILEIEFNNGVYQYFEVPAHVYEELINSGSKGSYLYQNIKGIYSYEQI
ncbi:KTSC domain-containing protein [Alkalimarinus sediminis]|uniref:KTSC domain-containing protein n=1 Tax=Alkalimarinus sediminis TaxID=1632866 RepID=A0A9E8HH84_9ALTE|nr:KTSC domain-containing protein [Alkalimarinus sediminis]UZW74230.1 KTSC domain-containing protein [Alkalimarinus sediminis]